MDNQMNNNNQSNQKSNKLPIWFIVLIILMIGVPIVLALIIYIATPLVASKSRISEYKSCCETSRGVWLGNECQSAQGYNEFQCRECVIQLGGNGNRCLSANEPWLD